MIAFENKKVRPKKIKNKKNKSVISTTWELVSLNSNLVNQKPWRVVS